MSQPKPNTRVPNTRVIVELVARHGMVPVSALIGPTKERRILRLRHLAMWLASKVIGASQTRIGAVLDKDHRAVGAGIKRIEAALAFDPALVAQRDRLVRAIEEWTPPPVVTVWARPARRLDVAGPETAGDAA